MKRMLLIPTILLSTLITHPAWSQPHFETLLNKITLQLTAEQWVTTKTALVNININAAVADQGVAQVQNDVMQKLQLLSNKGEWHIISLNRNLDSSGLENIQMVGQARLPQTELGNLRSKVKNLSKPGETFTLDDLQFVPSADELRAANAYLRNTIYNQAKAELDVLNKDYPNQKYYLHQIDFATTGPIMPMPIAQANAMYMKAAVENPSAQLATSNKVELQASVVLASMPDQVPAKLGSN